MRQSSREAFRSEDPHAARFRARSSRPRNTSFGHRRSKDVHIESSTLLLADVTGICRSKMSSAASLSAWPSSSCAGISTISPGGLAAFAQPASAPLLKVGAERGRSRDRPRQDYKAARQKNRLWDAERWGRRRCAPSFIRATGRRRRPGLACLRCLPLDPLLEPEHLRAVDAGLLGDAADREAE